MRLSLLNMPKMQ